MAAIYLDEGLLLLLQKRNGDAGGAAPSELHLFSNDVAVVKASVKADFTDITTLGGMFKTINSPDWGYSAVDGALHKLTASLQKNWTFTGTIIIRGWYISNPGNTKVLIAEKFDNPVTIPAGGGPFTLSINDVFQDHS